MNEKKLLPNILLTNICNQSCDYCFAKNEMKWAAKKEMSFADLQKIVDFLKKYGRNEIKLMGGEPTLHSRFKEIIDFILDSGFKIYLFTNGLFAPELAVWLGEKKSSIEYTINLTTPAFQSEAGKKILENNLRILRENAKITAAITIDDLNFNYDPLIDFMKKNKIEAANINIANNLIGASNWLKWDQYKSFGSVVVSLVKKLSGINVLEISLSCGFVPCMFTQKQIEEFNKAGITMNSWGCDSKKGAFDISTDLNAFPCFVLEDFKAKNLFDFKDAQTVKKFLENLFFYASDELLKFEPCHECLYFKRLECRGPCKGWVINNLNKQKIFANLPKTFYYKIIYNLLHLSRNWI